MLKLLKFYKEFGETLVKNVRKTVDKLCNEQAAQWISTRAV